MLPSAFMLSSRKRFPERIVQKGCLVLGYAAIALLYSFTLFSRQAELRSVVGVEQLQATYHALFTISALGENPVSVSKLLPIVTLARPEDRFIPWGATTPTDDGVYVYTSFPSPGFVVPLAFFRVLGRPPDLSGLVLFNWLLGFICALLLFQVLLRTLTAVRPASGVAIVSSLVGTGVLFFSREGLHSFGLGYWCQALAQVFILAQLLSLLNVWLIRRKGSHRSRALVALAVFSFLSPLTEWSGFAGNALICVLLLWEIMARDRRDLVAAKVIVLVATALAGLVICVQFFQALGMSRTMAALVERFIVRSAASSWSDTGALLVGYTNSYGLWIALLLAILLCVAFFHSPQGPDRSYSVVAFMLVAAFCPVVENAIMLQHATLYSFDRLKLAVPFAIAIAALLARLHASGHRGLYGVFIAIAVLCGRQSLQSYEKQKEPFAEWTRLNAANEDLRARLASSVDLTCVTLGTNGLARGYLDFVFSRNIHENIDIPTLAAESRRRGECGYVFLEQITVPPDIPALLRATIRRLDGKEIILWVKHGPR